MIHLILLLGMMQVYHPARVYCHLGTHSAALKNYDCTGSDGEMVDVIFDPPAPGLPKPGESWTFRDAGGSNNQVVVPSDPIDVPAIQEKQKVLEHAKGSSWACGFDWCTAHEDSYTTETVTTCKDRSRILLHSEDGKYYCHKPQTE